jgi:hypothetical protein
MRIELVRLAAELHYRASHTATPFISQALKASKMATLAERTQEVLSKAENREAALQFLGVLRTNLRECAASVDRRVQLLLATAVVCELVSHAAISEFSFAGLKLSNLTVFQKILPLITAYLSYSVFTGLSYNSLVMKLHSEMTRHLHPDFYHKNFELYEYPPTLFQTERLLDAELPGRFSSIMLALYSPLMLLLVLGPTIYLGYAHFRLVQMFGIRDPLVILSIAASLLFQLVAWGQFAGAGRVRGTK